MDERSADGAPFPLVYLSTLRRTKDRSGPTAFGCLDEALPPRENGQDNARAKWVYWAMLEGNECRGGNWFKDCWVGPDGSFEGDWDYLEEPYDVDGATLVFFPHGSLLFATQPSRGEVKIAVGNAIGSLLERIVAEWSLNNALPMFVSEGDTAQKERSISRHGYLSAVYRSKDCAR